MAHRNRLNSREFDAVFESGQRLGHKWFTLRVLTLSEGSDDETRWGFAVGKRLARSSVERNRLRRRLREAVRPLVMPGAAWCVVQLRTEGVAARPVELREAIAKALARKGKTE